MNEATHFIEQYKVNNIYGFDKIRKIKDLDDNLAITVYCAGVTIAIFKITWKPHVKIN